VRADDEREVFQVSERNVTTWRYHLPSLPDWKDTWSIVFVDSTGCVAICSDHGSWCYRWDVKHSGHDDFREFLLRADGDYVARKLGQGRKEELEVYDGERTLKNIRWHILQDRRHGDLTKEQARKEWELAGSEVEDNGIVGFHEWYQRTSYADAYEFARYRMSYGLQHWTKVSFLRLKEAIRAELAGERASSLDGVGT